MRFLHEFDRMRHKLLTLFVLLALNIHYDIYFEPCTTIHNACAMFLQISLSSLTTSSLLSRGTVRSSLNVAFWDHVREGGVTVIHMALWCPCGGFDPTVNNIEFILTFYYSICMLAPLTREDTNG